MWGEPCVVCALYDIFTALTTASTDMLREAVAPTSLRIALSNLYPDSNFFQEVLLQNPVSYPLPSVGCPYCYSVIFS